jgi:hypothetical protein
MNASTPAQRVVLRVRGLGHVPSFKNHKRAILDSKSGKMRTLTEPSIKQRMAQLEDALLCALYSLCLTGANEMDSGCRKRLQTFLCGLYDDSIAEIPRSSSEAVRVENGLEGLDVTIIRLEREQP